MSSRVGKGAKGGATAALRRVPIAWEALEDAFENNAPEVHSYLHLESGEVIRIVDGIADPAMHKRIIDDAIYLRIDPVSSREQYRWMERFIATVEAPELRNRLLSSIDGKGAFRRFKDVLMAYPVDRERWFTFRSERLRACMDAWLEAHDIEVVERPKWRVPTADDVVSQVEPSPERPKERPARGNRFVAGRANSSTSYRRGSSRRPSRSSSSFGTERRFRACVRRRCVRRRLRRQPVTVPRGGRWRRGRRPPAPEPDGIAFLPHLTPWLAGLTLLAALPAAAQSPVEVVGDGMAAVIASASAGSETAPEVILISDVELRARLRLAGQTQGPLPLGPLGGSLLRATLDELVGEVLIAREADRIRVAAPTEADVARERRGLMAQAGGETRYRALLEALGASPAEVLVMAERRARVRVFLQANLAGEARVTERQLEDAFRSGEHPFLGQELDDVREVLRVYLVRQALDRALRRWIEVLRGRSAIRPLAPWALGAAS